MLGVVGDRNAASHRRRRPRLLAVALFATLQVAATAGAAEFGTYRELPPAGSSSVAALVGPAMGIANQPRTFRLGLDYDFSLNGPLHMTLGGALGLSASVFDLHVAPGVRYVHLLDDFAWVPYAKAALAVDLFAGDGKQGRDLAVGVKLAVGAHYFFHRSLAVGPELAVTSGVASGDGGTNEAVSVDALIGVTYRIP